MDDKFANMSPCRTCESEVAGYHHLDEFSTKYPEKKYSDLLQIVAKVDINVAERVKLPDKICRICRSKLEEAFAFIMQTKKSEHHWRYFMLKDTIEAIKELENISKISTTSSINPPIVKIYQIKEDISKIRSTSPINPPIEEIYQVKEEKISDDECELPEDEFIEVDAPEVDAPASGISLKLEFEEEITQEFSMLGDSVIDEDNKAAVFDGDSLTQNELSTFAELDNYDDTEESIADSKLSISSLLIESTDRKERKAKRSIKSYVEDPDYEQPAAKRKESKSANYYMKDIAKVFQRAPKNEDGRFTCGVCDKTFAWRKDLYRHINTHYSVEVFDCSLCEKTYYRKDKLHEHLNSHQKVFQTRQLENNDIKPNFSKGNSEWSFGSRLYTEKPLQLRECKICLTIFPKNSDLKSHLLSHLENLKNHLSQESIIIKELYPQQDNLNAVAKDICEKLKAQDFNQFILVKNHYGYEMSLSDTDEDEEESKDPIVQNEMAKKYFCELCEKHFARKHLIFEHTKQKHKTDVMPYLCGICKLSFVSDEIFQQHLKTQCQNEVKKYHCLKCPGKFAWQETFVRHQCSIYSSVYSIKVKLNCDLCDSCDFENMNQLNQHKRMHFTKDLQHQCSHCGLLLPSKKRLHEHIHSEHEVSRNLTIKCCLCIAEFRKLSELRDHLPIHSDGVTACLVKLGLYYKTFYPKMREDQLKALTDEISQDFVYCSLSKFYLAADDEGNEVDLNDSETENESSEICILNKYTCDLCRSEFSRRLSLLEHQKSDHASQEHLFPYFCDQCNRRFVSFILLDQHLKRQCNNPYRQVRCEDCHTSFIWMENYRKHYKAKHLNAKISESEVNDTDDKDMECKECHKVFDTRAKYIRHKRTHVKVLLGCPYCDKNFNRIDHLRNHVKRHETGNVDNDTHIPDVTIVNDIPCSSGYSRGSDQRLRPAKSRPSNL